MVFGFQFSVFGKQKLSSLINKLLLYKSTLNVPFKKGEQGAGKPICRRITVAFATQT
jgi:hypothetical protein